MCRSRLAEKMIRVAVKQKEVFIMSVVSMKQLLEAGVHFGHQTRRWNPKMATVHLHRAQRDLHHRPAEDRQEAGRSLYALFVTWRPMARAVLFVGTKKQAQDAISEEAERVGQFYVNARWLGGMLTNFTTMRTRIDRLAQLRKMEEDGTFDHAAQEGSHQAPGARSQSWKNISAASRT